MGYNSHAARLAPESTAGSVLPPQFKAYHVEPNMTQDELKSRLHYNPETGIFTWLHNPSFSLRWNNRYPGAAAGSLTSLKYVLIRIDKKPYYAHRLAFLYLYGFLPKEVDHIDGDPSNNKISNLRAANRSMNMKNLCRNSVNTSGITGVCWDKARKKWIASIQVNGASVYRKRFSCKSDAISKRKELEKQHGFHENHGRERPS